MMCSLLQVILPALSLLYQLFDYCECQALSKPAPQCYNTATCPCCKPGTCPSGGTGLCGGNNCLDGYHGGKCWNKCPTNCVNCKDAPQGGGVATCTKCKEGYYSTTTQDQCQQRCHSSCKTCASSSSQCTSCNTGYYMSPSRQCLPCGQGCNICTSSSSRCSSCKPGYYLIPSQNKCEQCNALCHTCDSSGACVCYNGCNSDQCNENTGYCLYECKTGFAPTGTQTKCDSCVGGKYGNHCNIICNPNCDSTCDRATGFCSACKPKRYGNVCELQCPGNCLENCDKFSGVCEACVNGHHGNSCDLTCEQDCKECKQADGECTSCRDGLYGLECNKICSQHCIQAKCSRENGSCECSPGYEGDRCQLRVTTTEGVTTGINHTGVTQDTTKYITLVVGLTVAWIASIVVIVVGIVCYRRRGASGGSVVHAAQNEGTLHPEYVSYDSQTQTVHNTRAPPETNEASSAAMRESVRIYTSIDDVETDCNQGNLSRTPIVRTMHDLPIHGLPSSIATRADEYESLQRGGQPSSLYSQLDTVTVNMQSPKGSGNAAIALQDAVHERMESVMAPLSDQHESYYNVTFGEYQSLHTRRETSAIYTPLQDESDSARH